MGRRCARIGFQRQNLDIRPGKVDACRLVSGVNDILYTKVRELFPDTKRIILDLTNLTRVDSMGLGTLVRLSVSARSAGCSLELINLGKQVRQLLGMTNLLSVFAIIGEHGIKMG
jgi:anti-sigma B factor antagonist